MAEEQLGRIESALGRIESTVEGLKIDVARLDAGRVELGHQMRLLHQEALDRIAALQPQWSLFATKQGLAESRTCSARATPDRMRHTQE